MGDVESLLNDSIATEGYRIGPASKPEALVKLSEINSEALQAKFAQGQTHTEAEKLKRLVEGKLNQMVKLSSTRMGLAERFQKLIDAYNAGSLNRRRPTARPARCCARWLSEGSKRGEHGRAKAPARS